MSEQSKSIEQTRKIWSNYWATGAVEACLGGESQQSAALLTFWHEIFARFKSCQSVLDVATGNGFLPRLFLSTSPIAEMTFDAVDIAQINPTWLEQGGWSASIALRFHDEVLVEQLPFPDASFDWVISQFGVEYSDVERSLTEIARVLKPDGRIAFVIHDQHSLIVARAKEELQHLEWFFEQHFFNHTLMMCQLMAKAGTESGRKALSQDEGAIQSRITFNQLLSAAQNRAKTGKYSELIYELLDATMSGLNDSRQRADASIGETKLRDLQQAYQDMLVRQKALVACARNEQQIRNFAHILGRKLEKLVQLKTPDGLSIGWCVTFG
ncbi:class I SAM-dependent methyltransferase [Permianibacter aggregans]|uniref:Methyltransferase family protein n=1 Tax=Permianibacter aggregans TaxID=1510150 RepID=A0A4R6UMY9_9GAMM|nr:class I SAM-dependent methyltransferase [Permianibacter aggregans]QGX38942.1 class I SAM-dependent methyltransferase [Permianibacter aggregans]TDQ46813.1 methyltransferase family protein [Permianibacter aggregans]